MKRCLWLLTVLLVLSTGAYASDPQEKVSYLSFKLMPGVALPLGESGNYFTFGGNIGLSGSFRLPFLPILSLNGEILYDLELLANKSSQSVSVISVGGGAGLFYEISRFVIQAYGTGGGYFGFVNPNFEIESVYPYFSGGLGLTYMITPSLGIGMDVLYRNYLGLYNGAGASLNISYHIQQEKRVPKPKPPKEPRPEPKPEPAIEVPPKPSPLVVEETASVGGLEISEIEFTTVFPVLFKYYDENPIGTALLNNVEEESIEDIEVSLYVKQYMDSPKVCNAPGKLEAGEKAEIELNALFNDTVLGITEGTKVATQLILEYTLQGQRLKKIEEATLRLYDRNSLTWDDDRKVAAFVTAKDPDVLSLSKYTAGIVTNKGSQAVVKNLRIAMGMHGALAEYGMAYVVDPRTPYEELSKSETAVDFLQFPRHTLKYKAGDCDDLSILYNALLESVGVKTAFITIPGHIFTAFSVDMEPEEARKRFLRADELIFREGETWIPVEITEISGGFIKAWQTGAKQWREHKAREQAGFYPTDDAWKLYEPVGLPEAASGVDVPNRDKLTVRYLEELINFIDREIYPQVARIQAEINKTNESPTSVNKLGVLYSKYGLYERAEKEFQKILEKEEFVPALVNMGNVYFLQGDFEKAKEYYERAFSKAPNNPTVLLCVARINHELENYGMVRETYDKLKSLNPDLAIQFAYLELRGDEAARAAEIGQSKEIVIWDEEE